MPEDATVLDLACGDGQLLEELVREKHVRGSGVDIDNQAIEACVGKGLSVFHGDLDEGLADFQDGSHEVVILSLSLQQLRRPRMIVREMVRVGRLAIVSFPNFAHWSVRGQLLVRGRMPVSGQLPYQWWDTPNIHLCTIRDFRALCREEGLVHRARDLPAVAGRAAALAPGRTQPDGARGDLRRHAPLVFELLDDDGFVRAGFLRPAHGVPQRLVRLLVDDLGEAVAVAKVEHLGAHLLAGSRPRATVVVDGDHESHGPSVRRPRLRRPPSALASAGRILLDQRV